MFLLSCRRGVSFVFSTQLQHFSAPADSSSWGTSSKPRGGPPDQDLAADSAGLMLSDRFSDWHLGHFSREDSAWSVSVYVPPGKSG